MRKLRHISPDRVKLARARARTWHRILRTGRRHLAPTVRATLYTRRTSA